MLGAIAGDVIGSVYEGNPIKTIKFPLFNEWSRFTDDTVLTVAVAQAIMQNQPYLATIKALGQQYPNAGYGGSFRQWLHSPHSEPYNSWGNGSAMRVSPVGFAFDDLETVLRQAEKSAAITHNHPEGIKGAQATATAIFLARTGHTKESIRAEISDRFGYNLQRTVEEIRPDYYFDVSCQGSVPESIIAFLDSTDYENAVRLAISMGGDSDTMACIAGGIAQAFYRDIPPEIVANVRERLPAEFLTVVYEFAERYIVS